MSFDKKRGKGKGKGMGRGEEREKEGGRENGANETKHNS
jgi:hypothetical protein